MSRANLERCFPKLRQLGCQITSPESKLYNCIAWAAGRDDRWWQPSPGYFWPEEPHDCTPEAFVRVFRRLGYEVCEQRGLEPDFEKVALYVNDFGPAHMARQLPSGEWTSKCGKLEDITHPLEGLEGTEYEEYGHVAVIMKRKRSQLQTP
jgi:hypothetical protein